MPYVVRVDRNGKAEKKDRYYTPGRRKRENSKKAAATLRRLLTEDEKDLPEIKLEFGYERAEAKIDCK